MAHLQQRLITAVNMITGFTAHADTVSQNAGTSIVSHSNILKYRKLERGERHKIMMACKVPEGCL